MTVGTQYAIPEDASKLESLVLAIVVHLALFCFLFIGIRWVNETPTTVEAEIWDSNIREASPVKAPTPVEATPAETAQSTPVAKTPETREEPIKRTEEPDIALEQEKQAKREKERREKEQREQVALAQKHAQELKDKQADEKKAEEERKRKELADKKLFDKMLADDAKRIAGATAAVTPGKGTASRSTGPIGDPSWLGAIKSKIKSNTIFPVPADLVGNPSVEIRITTFPDGSVANATVTKPSGLAGFDAAVLTGINKSSPLPKDKSGSIPQSFVISYQPKD